MLNSNNIGVYADTYMEYLMNSKYKEDEDLKLFYYELKASQLREKMIENKKIKLWYCRFTWRRKWKKK